MRSNLAERLGVQSYCFRNIKDSGKLIKTLKECGIDKLEPCAVHLNPVNLPDAGAKALEEYTRAGITVTSYGVYSISADEAAARKVFEFARLAGFPTLSANLKQGGLEVAEKLCAEYDKNIAIHNHGRKHALGSVAALEELFGKASRRVGLCLDTAWMLDSGEDPVEIARKFKDRLYGLHIKDFIFDRQGKPEDVAVGQGNLALDKLAAFLKEIVFAGYLTLEYEGDVNNPAPAVKQCFATVRAALV